MLSQKVLSRCALLSQLESTVILDALSTCFVFLPRKPNNLAIPKSNNTTSAWPNIKLRLIKLSP